MSWSETEWRRAGGAEIEGLHRFLVGWLGGALPRDATTFARFAGVLAPGFAIVSPRGVMTEREALCRELEAAQGVHAEAEPRFAIRIAEVILRRTWAEHALFTYEEWQEVAGAVTGRLSSVVFGREPGAPRGVAWLHLHETWLPGHAGGA